jgi:hypothetical protein
VQPNNNVLMVDERHNGPPNSGNGGWTSGLIAAFITDGTPEITLHKPPPLLAPLTVVPAADGLRVVDAAEAVIATGRRREADIEPVPPVSLAQGRGSIRELSGTRHTSLSYLFRMRPAAARRPADLPGALARGRHGGGLRGARGHRRRDGVGGAGLPGRLDRDQRRAPMVCWAGWPWRSTSCPSPARSASSWGRDVRRDGRKALVRTTLYGADGRLCARAEATWIAIPPV